jgi:hypothetical protein
MLLLRAAQVCGTAHINGTAITYCCMVSGTLAPLTTCRLGHFRVGLTQSGQPRTEAGGLKPYCWGGSGSAVLRLGSRSEVGDRGAAWPPRPTPALCECSGIVRECAGLVPTTVPRPFRVLGAACPVGLGSNLATSPATQRGDDASETTAAAD